MTWRMARIIIIIIIIISTTFSTTNTNVRWVSTLDSHARSEWHLGSADPPSAAGG